MAPIPWVRSSRAAASPSSRVSPATKRSTTGRASLLEATRPRTRSLPATLSSRWLGMVQPTPGARPEAVRPMGGGGSGRVAAYTSPVNDGLAVLGCGKIGEILAAGLLASGWRAPDQITVTDRVPERVRELADRYRVRATTSNPEAVRDAGILIVAVKPTDVDALLAEIATEVTPDKLVISVAAAISTSFIERRLPHEVPVVRAMPNAPAQVGAGIAGICAGSSA